MDIALNDKIQDINNRAKLENVEIELKETKMADEIVEERLNFLGYTYCPLKLTFKEHFDKVLNVYSSETGDKDFKYYVPSGCHSGDPYEELWKKENSKDLPEIIASVGFGDFFRSEFVNKFVNKGLFKSIAIENMNSAFVDAGILDPMGYYTVYSIFPLVMLVDKKKLGDLPMPRYWKDLMNPEYEKNIIIGASHGDYHEELFVYLDKEYGDEGVVKIAPNIKGGCHASQMARMAGTNSKDGAAIYVMPWMFAKSCPRTNDTEVIWPEDGAITTPTYMLVKNGSEEKYKLFIDFLLGSTYGKASSDNYFPVINGAVENKIPNNGKLKWLGWDYIRAHDLQEIKEHVTQLFKAQRPDLFEEDLKC